MEAAAPGREDLVLLAVTGLACAACASRVEAALRGVAGVADASVNLAAGRARVACDLSRVEPAALAEAIRRAGYGAEVLEIEGPGAGTGGGRGPWGGAGGPEPTRRGPAEPQRVPLGSVRDREERARAEEQAGLRRRLTVAASLTALIMLGSLPGLGRLLPAGLLAWLSDWRWLLALATPVQFWAGGGFYRAAGAALRHGGADMNLLVCAGTTAAYGYSAALTLFPGLWRAAGAPRGVYFDTAAAIITLVLLGRLLEARARGRTSGAIRRLVALSPPLARVLVDGREREAPLEAVKVGDVLSVRPGERVPVDGVILEGASSLDESVVTGEALPADRGPGEAVVGATLNLTGAFLMRASGVGRDTFLARMVRLVEAAQASRAPVQRLADRVAARFVPAVLAASALTFGAWYLLGPRPSLAPAVVYAVAVLVVACPCALGLATPAAVTVGLGRGAELGVLVRSGEVLEAAGRVRTVVFDKTGTLTWGRPVVAAVELAPDWPAPGAAAAPAAAGHMNGAAPATAGDRGDTGDAATSLLSLAASAELPSEHPLGRALGEAARSRGLDPRRPEEFRALPGLGVEARVGSAWVLVGNARLMESRGVELGPLVERAGALARRGATPSFMAVRPAGGRGLAAAAAAGTPGDAAAFAEAAGGRGYQAAGLLALEDELKPGARPAVERLRALGLDVVMLTGDNRFAALAVAARAGIGRVLAEVPPEGKAEAVLALRREGGPVAMVGDGINDAPALARADVGLALGTGTDVAIEAAGITLASGDPRGAALAVELSRRTLGVVRQNLFWAFFYNLLAVPVAAGALVPLFGLRLDPILAALAMTLSSLSVVLNSLRLRSFAPRRARGGGRP